MRLRMAAGGLLAVMLLGSAAASFAQNTEDPRQRVVTIRLRDVSLRAALDILMRDTGLTYQLPRDIEVPGITLDLEGLPLEQALHAILTAQGLTYRYLPDAKLYVIERAPESVTPAETTVPEPPPTTVVLPEPLPTETAPRKTETTTRVIAIRYGDAADISTLFGGMVAPGRFQTPFGFGTGAYGGLTGSYSSGNYPYGVRGPIFSGYGLFGYGPNWGTAYSGYPTYGTYGGYGVGYGANDIPRNVVYGWP
jgi:hypothetical protein